MSYNAFLSQFFYFNVLKQRFSVFLSTWVDAREFRKGLTQLCALFLEFAKEKIQMNADNLH